MPSDDFIKELHNSTNAAQITSLLKQLAPPVDRQTAGAIIRTVVLHQALQQQLQTAQVLKQLPDTVGPQLWSDCLAPALLEQLPELLVQLVDSQAELGHDDLLGLLDHLPPASAVAVLNRFSTYLDTLNGSVRLLRGMRAARIQADICAQLKQTKIAELKLKTSTTDDAQIANAKNTGTAAQLATAFKEQVNQLQRLDLQHSLNLLDSGASVQPSMAPADWDKTFRIDAPLRLGLSSANASDNHLRSKEQGAKTLNVGVDLRIGDEAQPSTALQVSARRLGTNSLVLRSRSAGFKGDLKLAADSDPGEQAQQFFAYRQGGDESLRLVKQALVHTGIVADQSSDILADIARFTGGGGLEIITSCKVLQGSGLGTSSILAAAILKTLYRLSGSPLATAAGEYPALYDQSLLLEQSIGLNSGWQDARGACGGPSAVKDFYAPPTAGLPAPKLSYIEVDESRFTERIILFNTGIARAATRGLNVVLDAYLSRDRQRYPAIGQSLAIHDQMVEALRQGDYAELGRLSTRYWQLRCVLDPDATSPSLQHLFEAPELRQLCDGGLLTGAGGGGFALLIARDGCSEELRHQLTQLRSRPDYSGSAVVDYRLNPNGIQLSE